MTLVDALVEILKDLGVRFVFGVSGANIEHLHDAIYRLGDNELTAVLAKSEFSAAFMADGHARAHNTLGVCCATSGAGMFNLAVGIAEAYSDNVPVLAIIGQPPTYLEGKGAFQDSSGKTDTIDGLIFWKTITKHTVKIIDPYQFWDYLEKTLKSIFEKKPGPSALLIPRDLFEAQVSPRPINFSTRLDDYRTVYADEQILIDQLLSLLTNSTNPLVIVGKHPKNLQIDSKIKAFVDAFHCRVVTTFADVNAFAHLDPHYLGMIGVCGHSQAHDFLKNHTDLVIAIEEDFSVMTTASIEQQLNDITICFLGADAKKACAAVKIDLVVEGDINTLIEKLLANRVLDTNSSPHTKKMQATIEKFSPALDKSYDKIGLSASQVMQMIENYLPKISTMVFDAGNCVASAVHHLTFLPHIQTLIALGTGSMGYAIPAAIGAQIGNVNQERTMVITGDGGFLVSGLEIHTAIEYNLAILYIIFNNNMHGMCVTRQQLFFANRIIASTYGDIHINQVVKGLGNNDKFWCERVDSLTDLESCLQTYYENHSHKPGVLEIIITQDEIPPFIPFLKEQEKPRVKQEKSINKSDEI